MCADLPACGLDPEQLVDAPQNGAGGSPEQMREIAEMRLLSVEEVVIL
jgi:hypothetical protein